MNVTWNEKKNVGEVEGLDNIYQDFTHQGTVLGTIRKWFRTYLVVMCSDGIVREVRADKVKVKEEIIDTSNAAILFNLVETIRLVSDKFTLVEKYFDMMKEAATIPPMTASYSITPTLKFDLPKKPKRKPVKRKAK